MDSNAHPAPAGGDTSPSELAPRAIAPAVPLAMAASRAAYGSLNEFIDILYRECRVRMLYLREPGRAQARCHASPALR
jgi:hypothetical protein